VEAQDLIDGRRARPERHQIVEQAGHLDEVAEPALRLGMLVVLPGLDPPAVAGQAGRAARIVPHVQLVIDPSGGHGRRRPPARSGLRLGR
jgi:hypothetical protein